MESIILYKWTYGCKVKVLRKLTSTRELEYAPNKSAEIIYDDHIFTTEIKDSSAFLDTTKYFVLNIYRYSSSTVGKEGQNLDRQTFFENEN